MVKGAASPERWIDQTGNDIDAYQDNAANQPTLYRLSPTWNGNPVIDFQSSSNHFLEIADNAAMNDAPTAQTERTITAVFRTGQDIESRQIIFEEGGGSRGLNIYIENDTLYIGGWNLADDADPSVYPWPYTCVKYEIQPNTPYFAILEFDYETDSIVSGYLNGERKELAGAGLLYPHGDDIGIGAMNGWVPVLMGGCVIRNASYFDGFIAEFFSNSIVYNSAQRKIVNNYLAAKYRITLPVGKDLYDYELGYHNELIGIGQDSASSFHLAAKGSGLVKIQNPSNVGDGKYLFTGHDNDSIERWVNSEVPNDDENIQRVLREWRVDKQGGDIGATDLHFDTSALAAMPSGYSDYIIMVDADGDFSSGATVTKLEDNGDGYFVAAGVDFNKGDYFTVGVIQPAVKFSLSESGGPENIDEFIIDIELNYKSSIDIQVDYQSSDITAAVGQAPTPDYNELSGTLTIPAGDLSASVTLEINNDLVVENDEQLLITLSNPSAGVAIGADTTHTFTIQDDDQSRKVQFTDAGSSGPESNDSVYLHVELSEPNAGGETTVEYRVLTSSSTATEDSVDYYILMTDTIVFPANVTDTTILLTVINDLSDEYDETVVIELYNPISANLGFNTIHTYTIEDDDPAPAVGFARDSVSGMESISPVELMVILSVKSGREITVDYEAYDIDAQGQRRLPA